MDQHKERIIDESIALFLQRGIRGITMDDVSKQCGISKRTLYEIFANKKDLLIQCVEKIHYTKRKCHEEIVANSDNVIEVLLGKITQVMKDTGDQSPAFFIELKKLYPSISAIQEKFFKEFATNEISRFIKKGINQGLFRNELNVEIVTDLLIVQIRFVFFELMNNTKYNRIEIFQTMLISFTRGISTPKGIEIVERFEKENFDNLTPKN